MSKEKKAPKASATTRKRRTAEEMAPIKAIMAETGLTLKTVDSCISGHGSEKSREKFLAACERLGIDPKTLK